MSEHEPHHHHKDSHDHKHDGGRTPERLAPLVHPKWLFILGVALMVAVVLVWMLLL